MRVLIVRLRAIGDVIHGLPVACALKDHVPGAFVAWLAEDRASELLVGHPAIDQRITVARGWAQLRRELRALRFDVVLDLHGVRSSVLATILSGAPRRLGFVGMVSHEARRLITNENRQRALSRMIAGAARVELVQARSSHIVDRYLEILAPLGVHAPVARFGFPEFDDDASGVDGAFAVINCGGPVARMWPADRFAAVARYLGSAHGLPTLVHGWGERELDASRRIVAESQGHARLTPALSLRQLAALARRSRVFISADTGPLHLAAAVGAPCIGLIGSATAERFRPYGHGNIVVPGEPVAAIRVDDVCQACDRILSGAGL